MTTRTASAHLRTFPSMDNPVELRGVYRHPNGCMSDSCDDVDHDLESIEKYFQSTANIFVPRLVPTFTRLDSIEEELEVEAEAYPHLLKLPQDEDVDVRGDDVVRNHSLRHHRQQQHINILPEEEKAIQDLGVQRVSTSFQDSNFSKHPPADEGKGLYIPSKKSNGGPTDSLGVPTEEECASMIDCDLSAIVLDSFTTATGITPTNARTKRNKHRRASCVML
jgi:hypothetical protein